MSKLIFIYTCTQYRTESTSPECAVSLDLVVFSEDLILAPDFNSKCSKQLKKVQMGRS